MSLRGRLLREHSLSLVKAVELSKASEIAKEQLHKLEKGERKTSRGELREKQTHSMAKSKSSCHTAKDECETQKA